MGDIFREIDEELRHERFEKLWRKFGRYVIAAGVALIVAVAGVSGWNQYQTSQRHEEGARFAAAKDLLRTGKTDDAAALFAALSGDSTTTYGSLAKFHQAALRAKSGDIAGAVALYDALAADSGLDRPLRDLAVILSALHSVNGRSPDVAALTQRLEPLSAANQPWRHSALEILALLSHRKGDTRKAKEYYQRIADDVDAPQNLRARATQMLAIFGP